MIAVPLLTQLTYHQTDSIHARRRISFRLRAHNIQLHIKQGTKFNAYFSARLLLKNKLNPTFLQLAKFL